MKEKVRTMLNEITMNCQFDSRKSRMQITSRVKLEMFLKGTCWGLYAEVWGPVQLFLAALPELCLCLML